MVENSILGASTVAHAKPCADATGWIIGSSTTASVPRSSSAR